MLGLGLYDYIRVPDAAQDRYLIRHYPEAQRFNCFLLCLRFGTSHLPHVHKFELHSLSEKGLVAKSRNMAGCSKAFIAFTFNFHNKPSQ